MPSKQRVISQVPWLSTLSPQIAFVAAHLGNGAMGVEGIDMVGVPAQYGVLLHYISPNQ